MSGGVRTVTKVVEADISKASASLASAVEAHRFSLEQALKGKDAVVGMEKINETVTTPIGKEAEAAVIKGTYREVIVQYDRTALDELLASMMERRVEYAAAIQTQEPVITFDKTIDGGATIAVVQNGTVSAPFDPEKINTKLITGKKITDSEEIVKTMPGVGGVEITVKPKFLRRLPRLRDHIEIIVGED